MLRWSWARKNKSHFRDILIEPTACKKWHYQVLPSCFFFCTRYLHTRILYRPQSSNWVASLKRRHGQLSMEQRGWVHKCMSTFFVWREVWAEQNARLPYIWALEVHRLRLHSLLSRGQLWSVGTVGTANESQFHCKFPRAHTAHCYWLGISHTREDRSIQPSTVRCGYEAEEGYMDSLFGLWVRKWLSRIWPVADCSSLGCHGSMTLTKATSCLLRGNYYLLNLLFFFKLSLYIWLLNNCIIRFLLYSLIITRSLAIYLMLRNPIE